MPSAKLTKGFVDTAKPLHGKPQALFWDTDLKGFGLLVGRSAKSFVVQRSGGRRRTIGRYPVITVAQARQRALEVLAAIGNGTADEGLPEITLIQAGDLHRKRMIRKGCAERSLEDINYRLNRYLADWLDRPLGGSEAPG